MSHKLVTVITVSQTREFYPSIENTRVSMKVMHGAVEFIPERNAAKVILSARHIGA